MDTSARKLQEQTSGTMVKGVDTLMGSNQQLNHLFTLRDGLKDLILFISKIQAANDKRSVAVLRDSVTNTIKAMTQACKELKGMDKVADEVTQKLAGLNEKVTASRGLAFLQLQYLSEEDEKLKEKIESLAKESGYELTYVLPTIEKEIVNANTALKSNTKEMSTSIDSFGSTNQILSQAYSLSQLNASLVTRITNCIIAKNMNDFNRETSLIGKLFTEATQLGQQLKDFLTKEKNEEELRVITAFMGASSTVRDTFSGRDGVVEKVKASIESTEELVNLNAKMRKNTAKNLEESKKNVSQAEINAEHAVTLLNRAARSMVSVMIIVGGIVVIVTLIMGVLISRSITKPIGAEPAYIADIAGKIAAGDVSMEIDTKGKDEKSLIVAMRKMVETIGQLVADAGMLSKAAVEGNLATRADATKHQGDFQKIGRAHV